MGRGALAQAPRRHASDYFDKPFSFKTADRIAALQRQMHLPPLGSQRRIGRLCALCQPMCNQRQRQSFVGVLAAFGLHPHADPAGDMGGADGRFGFVDMLTTGARSTAGFKADFVAQCGGRGRTAGNADKPVFAGMARPVRARAGPADGADPALCQCFSGRASRLSSAELKVPAVRPGVRSSTSIWTSMAFACAVSAAST